MKDGKKGNPLSVLALIIGLAVAFFVISLLKK